MSSDLLNIKKESSSLSSFEKVLEEIESPTSCGYPQDFELFDDSLLTVPISSSFLPVSSANEITLDFSSEPSFYAPTNNTGFIKSNPSISTSANSLNNYKYSTSLEDESTSFIDSLVNGPYPPPTQEYNSSSVSMFLSPQSSTSSMDYQDIIRPATNVVPSTMLSFNPSSNMVNLPPASTSTLSTGSSISSSSLPLTFKKGKKCCVEGCIRRAQSNSRCKAHGGGARCQFHGCNRSSQGGGFCRTHGGGKKCQVEGCNKGTQRSGLCFFHGGIRICQREGCTKKDRGNGYCISHGGGKKCQVISCNRLIRRGAFCSEHTEMLKPYKRLSSLHNINNNTTNTSGKVGAAEGNNGPNRINGGNKIFQITNNINDNLLPFTDISNNFNIPFPF